MNNLIIELSIGGPLVDAINNLASALQTSGLIERAQTAATLKAPRKSKTAQPEVATNTGSNGSEQDAVDSTEPAAEGNPPLPTEDTVLAAPESEAVAPVTHKDVQAVCQVKSKIVGSEKIKDTIAPYGEHLASVPLELLPELKAKLEALK